MGGVAKDAAETKKVEVMNDKKTSAADEWRLHQARQLIDAYRVKANVGDEEVVIKAYAAVPTKTDAPSEFRSVMSMKFDQQAQRTSLLTELRRARSILEDQVGNMVVWNIDCSNLEKILSEVEDAIEYIKNADFNHNAQ